MNNKAILILLFLYNPLFCMEIPTTGGTEPTTSEAFSSFNPNPQSLQALMAQNPQLIMSRVKGPWLDLSDLNLNSLEGIQNITNPIGIESLSINDNPIAKLNKTILQYFPNLSTLNATNTQLKSIDPYLFEKNPKLRIINVSDNPLHKIDRRHWAGLKNLEVLNLNNTQLTHIDFDTFAGLPQLKILVLNNNQLTDFNAATLRLLTNLNALNLAGNPLSKEIIESLKKEFPKIRIFSKD